MSGRGATLSARLQPNLQNVERLRGIAFFDFGDGRRVEPFRLDQPRERVGILFVGGIAVANIAMLDQGVYVVHRLNEIFFGGQRGLQAREFAAVGV